MRKCLFLVVNVLRVLIRLLISKPCVSKMRYFLTVMLIFLLLLIIMSFFRDLSVYLIRTVILNFVLSVDVNLNSIHVLLTM